MKKSRLNLARFAPIAVLALAFAGCSTPTGDVMARYGPLDIDGDFGVRAKGSGETFEKTDVKTAGFSKDSGVLGLRGDVDFGVPKLTLSLQGSGHGGIGTLTGTLDDGDGNVIPKGSDVSSNLDLGLYQALITFDVIPGDTVDLGFGTGVTGVDFDARITDITSGGLGHTVSESAFVPIPLLVLDTAVTFGAFRATGTFSAMSLQTGGDLIRYLDLDLLARYRILDDGEGLGGSVGLGYRLLELESEYTDTDEIELDLRFSGPYLAVIFSF